MTGGPGSGGAVEAWRLMRELVLDNDRRLEVCEVLGLSFGRIRALRRVAEGDLSMGELAAALAADAPYTTTVVDALEQQGLVERRPHPGDGRSKLVVATDEGRRQAGRAREMLEEPPPSLLCLSAGQVAQLVCILRSAAASREVTSRAHQLRDIRQISPYRLNR